MIAQPLPVLGRLGVAFETGEFTSDGFAEHVYGLIVAAELLRRKGRIVQRAGKQGSRPDVRRVPAQDRSYTLVLARS